MYKYIVHKNGNKLIIATLGNGKYNYCNVCVDDHTITLRGDGKLLSTIETKAESLEDLKTDGEACRLLIGNIVKYFRASDNSPSLWRFNTLKAAENFAACFGYYQNPEWGRDIVVARGANNYYYVGEPELF